MPTGEGWRAARRSRQEGVTYLGLLIAVAVIGVGLAGAGVIWQLDAKREREAQLLFVGDQFRQAIAAYYRASPGTGQYPQKLEDLLEDKRQPALRRYLRRIWRDPFSGEAQWGLVRGPDERIRGVYSLAPGTPLKIDNFAPPDAAFAGQESYAGWQFVWQEAAPAQPTAQATPGPAAPR
jgi:type II secretory pathway pseudopilin PulG